MKKIEKLDPIWVTLPQDVRTVFLKINELIEWTNKFDEQREKAKAILDKESPKES